jgi:RND superfamily putative drug exporter
MAKAGERFARAVIRWRLFVIGGWIAALAALAPFSQQIEDRLQAAARIDGADSARVVETLERRFASPFAHTAVLIGTGLPAPERPEGRAALERIVETLRATPGVAATASWLDAPDPFFGAGDLAIVLVGFDPNVAPVETLVPALRARTEALSGELRSGHPEATLLWTGEDALNVDLRTVGTAEARTAEMRVVPLTLALLFLAFGGLVAAGIPVLTGVLALPMALGIAVLLTALLPVSVLLVNVVTMIGLGLGIDYSLLMVSRFRETLRAGVERFEAARLAVRSAGATIATSGLAVAVGFAALLVMPITELRSVGLGGLLAAVASVSIATTLVPAVLALLGRHVDAVRLPLLGRRTGAGTGWLRWARLVASRPWLVLILSAGPLIALAAHTATLSIDFPSGDWLPAEAESIKAGALLGAAGRDGLIAATPVILELPDGVAVGSDAGWAALETLAQRLSAQPEVERVRTIAAPLGGTNLGRAMLDLAPETVRRSFVSSDGQAALLIAVPRQFADQQAVTDLIRTWRQADPASLTGLPGSTLLIGGLPAFNAEYQDIVAGWMLPLIGLVSFGTFLVLAWRYRAILVPLKAVVLNLLSVGATFGAMVFVFQDGHDAGLFGLDGPAGGVFPIVPVLVFCTIFGLSIDYEIFLVGRLAEFRKAGLDDKAALIEALTRTGRVITSAALIMMIVFAAFMMSDFLLVRMLGFALTVAVLIDATVVRLALGPALLRLAGRWNWWPGR